MCTLLCFSRDLIALVFGMSFFLGCVGDCSSGLFQIVCWPSSLSKLFNKWQFSYSKSFLNKPTLKRLWVALPKYICWKIWLGRNKTLFLEETAHPSSIAGKAIGLLSEHLNSKVNKSFPVVLIPSRPT